MLHDKYYFDNMIFQPIYNFLLITQYLHKLDTMIDCLILALNGNFKMNIIFCVVSIHPVKGCMN